MARYNETKAVDKHHLTAIAKTLRHYADRFDNVAAQMEERSIQVMPVTHFKSMLSGVERIQKFLNAAVAAHERMLFEELDGKDFMTITAAVERLPNLNSKGSGMPTPNANSNEEKTRAEAAEVIRRSKKNVPREKPPRTRRKKPSR